MLTLYEYLHINGSIFRRVGELSTRKRNVYNLPIPNFMSQFLILSEMEELRTQLVFLINNIGIYTMKSEPASNPLHPILMVTGYNKITVNAKQRCERSNKIIFASG